MFVELFAKHRITVPHCSDVLLNYATVKILYDIVIEWVLYLVFFLLKSFYFSCNEEMYSWESYTASHLFCCAEKVLQVRLSHSKKVQLLA